MNGSEVVQIVDKLAEKIGVAADELAPIAVETIGQVARWGMGQAIAAILVLGMAAWCLRSLIRNAPLTNSKSETASITAGIKTACAALGCVVFTIVGLLWLYDGLYRALAPIPWLLNSL